MQRRSLLKMIPALAVAGPLAVSSRLDLLAQDAATPEATDGSATPVPVATSTGVSLVAGGLVNPRGFTWSPDGDLYVALAGSGITSMGHVENPKQYQYGPYFGENTASVVRIETRLDTVAFGCPVTVAGGLPSTRGMGGHEQGPTDVAFLGGELYVLQDGGDDAETMAPDMPNGVYRVESDGSVTNIADLLTWTAANPVGHIPYDLGAEGEPFAMLAGDGFLWVLEANSGQVLKVTPQGDITRVADLSEGHLVPTGFALSPNGGVYVGFLTSAPYPNGASKVIEVMPDGTFTDVWTGLTAVTGLAVGQDGTLYAVEMSSGNTNAPPFTVARSGRILRQTGPSSFAEVVTGIDYPIAMRMGPDNALYVAFPAFGGDPPIGGILRIDLAYPQPMTVSPDILKGNLCDVDLPTEAPPDHGMDDMDHDDMASPEAGDASTPEASADEPPVPAEDPGKSQTGAVAVEIKDFAFSPDTVEIPAGTVVTWTNLDTSAHTATAQDNSFNSGNLNPSEAFSFTFETAGSYVYNCQYHPNMQGTIVVK